MMNITNPHDKVFKEIESIKENVVDLINATFPDNIKNKLDLETLYLDNKSYIDENLGEYFSDLVYNCKYKDNNKEVKISLLFEHKSSIPDYPHIQLLKYIVMVWDENIKQKKKPQIVIPVIFYHGKKKWKVRELFEYFDYVDDDIKEFIPRFSYILTDLAKYSDKDIKEKLFAREANKIFCLLLKHIFDENYIKKGIEDIFIIGKNYFNTNEGNNFLISMLSYN